MLTYEDRMVGCLLGGAIGDALGAPVEFGLWPHIQRDHGPAGITDLVVDRRGKALITDDTQMTLFTAEGVLAARREFANTGEASTREALYFSYLRWLATQGEKPTETPGGRPVRAEGALYEQPGLHERRDPGITCVGALCSGHIATPQEPLNDSKGCGGVMRVAPVAAYGFDAGVTAAALTHSHPTGYLAGGALAEILRFLLLGRPLSDAVDAAMDRLAQHERGSETAEAIIRAADAAASGRTDHAEVIAGLGQGWIAEEALGIALYAVLVAQGDVRRGLTVAVNHSGDSDSTGAIAGNVLGAWYGAAALPPQWIAAVEFGDLIGTVARDLSQPPPVVTPGDPSTRAAYEAHARAYPYR